MPTQQMFLKSYGGVAAFYSVAFDGSDWLDIADDSDFTFGTNDFTIVWYHIAVTRDSNTFRIFLNGVLKGIATSSVSAPAPGEASSIGRFSPASPYYYANGTVSNFRYIKGTALYTSAFTPPTNGLTNVTNTKLLCCNTSTTTGSTVTPGTITANGDPTASSSNPF